VILTGAEKANPPVERENIFPETSHFLLDSKFPLQYKLFSLNENKSVAKLYSFMSIRERKEREKIMRRQQIQNAAKELFSQKGFSSTTIEEIAEKTELSPATLYLYFRNKEELYVSLVLITLQYLNEQIGKVYHNKKLPIESKILKFKDAMYNTFQYDPLLLRIILHVQLEGTLSSVSKDLRDQITDSSREVMRMIADVYGEVVRQGKFREAPNMAPADIIWSMFTGLVIWEESKQRMNPQKDYLKQTLSRAFDIFCRGIKKDKVGKNER
jgi:AcrR family transcriptional regulator